MSLFAESLEAQCRIRERIRLLAPHELQALTPQQWAAYRKRIAEQCSADSREHFAILADQCRREPRPIITDDDLHGQGDLDLIDTRRRYEFGE